jgi:hypothetical protein
MIEDSIKVEFEAPKNRPLAIYLATPVDYIDQRPGESAWITLATKNLERMGHIVYTPIRAWSVDLKNLDRRTAQIIQGTNDVALTYCDILVARLGYPSCGIPREILLADDLHKCIIGIKSDQRHKSVFEWNVSMELVDCIEQAIKLIRSFGEDIDG